MADKTKIAWCDMTFNPWRGCVKVSPGCQYCYAEKMSHRNPAVLGEWGPNSWRAPASDDYWRRPLQWDKAAAGAGQRPKVFCGSLMDVFEDHEQLFVLRLRLWELIANTPHLDWLLLTKRPENIVGMVPSAWMTAWPRNAWLGVSVENQDQAQKRIPLLCSFPAPVRFLSCEPLLGNVYMSKWLDPDAILERNLVDWVIVGGESGKEARPMYSSWADGIQEQCAVTKTPFFFKQTGTWLADSMSLTSVKGDNPVEWPVKWQRQEFPRG